jgi:hypothetical protein
MGVPHVSGKQLGLLQYVSCRRIYSWRVRDASAGYLLLGFEIHTVLARLIG